MFNTELFVSSARKFSVFVILFLLVYVFSVFSQTDLRDAVYGKPKTAPKTNSSGSTNKSKTNKPAQTKNTVAAAKSTPRPTKKKVAKSLIAVTFIAKEPSVEVWLNDKKIGLTNDELHLSRKLTPGEYRLVAKNKQQVLISKSITIDNTQNSFELFEKPAPIVQMVEPQPVVEPPVEKTKDEISKELGDKVKNIIDKYESPETIDSITLEDWQFVLQNYENGSFSGFTAVQIEAHRWLSSGQIELAKRDYPSAIIAFNKANEYMGLWGFPIYELGNTYLAMNQTAEAIKNYQKALQINNKLGMVYKRLGDAQRLSDKEKEALTAYESAIQYGYRNYETRLLLAQLRIENKQIEKGIEEYEALIKENPKAEIFIKLGEAYEKNKLPFSAIENYKMAISLDPNSAAAHHRIGAFYMSRKEYGKAKVSLEKAISLDPSGKVLDIKDAQKKLREIAVKSNR